MSVCKNRHQLWQWECPVCGRVERLSGTVKGTQEQLEDLGWRQTSQLTSDSSRVLVCPAHYKAGGRTIFNNDGNRIRPETWDL